MPTQIAVESIQKAIAPVQPNLSTTTPVPAAERAAPTYPKIPVNPIEADATFLELLSTAHKPPINICGPAVKTPIIAAYT